MKKYNKLFCFGFVLIFFILISFSLSKAQFIGRVSPFWGLFPATTPGVNYALFIDANGDLYYKKLDVLMQLTGGSIIVSPFGIYIDANELAVADYGDFYNIGGDTGFTIEDDSHNHIITNIDNFYPTIGDMVTNNTETYVFVEYDDTNYKLNFTLDPNLKIITNTAPVADNDSNVPSCDHVYDFCETTQDYLKTSELTQEHIEDYINGLINDPNGSHTGITASYDDPNNAMSLIIDPNVLFNYEIDTYTELDALVDGLAEAIGGAGLTQENVEDYIDGLINDPNGSHTGIDVSYDDTNNAMSINLDLTEINSVTFGDNSTNPLVYTFNTSDGSDPNFVLTGGAVPSFAFNGNFGIPASNYFNFGSTFGDSGYGFYDSGGTLQYKNSGGSWANLASSAAIADRAKYDRVVAADGTGTDPNIADAISNASAGDSIFISAGTYEENITIDKKVSLFGAGINTTIIAGSTGSPTITIDTNVSDITLSDFTVTNSGTASTDNVIDFPDSNPATRYNNVIRNLYISGGYHGIYIEDSNICKIRNCVIYNNTNDGIEARNSLYIEISHCEIAYSGAVGIYIAISANPIILSNNIYSSTSYGMMLSGSTYANVTGNYIRATGHHGIYATQSDYSTVSSNSIHSAGNGSGEHGIYINQMGDSTCANNMIYDPYSDGINLYTADHCTVSNNAIYSAGGDGIDLAGNSTTFITVAANTINGCTGFGINLEGAFDCTDSIIIGNMVENNTAGSIYATVLKNTNNSYIANHTRNATDVHDDDLMYLTYFPDAGKTFNEDLIELRMDANDANSFTGNALHIVVDQSQNTGYPILIEDDAGTDVFVVTEAGKTGIGVTPDPNALLTLKGAKAETPSSQIELAAGDLITYTQLLANAVLLVSGKGGTTLTSTPTIAAGVNGQRITLVGMNDTNTIAFQDEGSLGGSTLELEAASVTLGLYDTLELIYINALSKWVQVNTYGNN